MKPDIHPDYRAVVFQDGATGKRTLTRSTEHTVEKFERKSGRRIRKGI